MEGSLASSAAAPMACWPVWTSSSATGRWNCCSGWCRWTRRPSSHPPAHSGRRGGGCRRRRERGRALVYRLAGQRARDGGKAEGPLRLITVTEEADGERRAGRWVNLIHETLIRSKGLDADGKPQPYWPTLWRYIEQNKERAARRERLQTADAGKWKDRQGLARLFEARRLVVAVRFSPAEPPTREFIEQRDLCVWRSSAAETDALSRLCSHDRRRYWREPCTGRWLAGFRSRR